MLPFVVTKRHLRHAYELEDPRVHVLSGFSFLVRDFFIASNDFSSFCPVDDIIRMAIDILNHTYATTRPSRHSQPSLSSAVYHCPKRSTGEILLPTDL